MIEFTLPVDLADHARHVLDDPGELGIPGRSGSRSAGVEITDGAPGFDFDGEPLVEVVVSRLMVRVCVSTADWNVVPFPVAGIKNGGSSPAERSRAARWTREAIDLLPNVEIVLLLGTAARDGWRRAAVDRDGIYVPSGNIPHCSARGLNTAGGRERFERAIQHVAELLRVR